MKLTSIGLYYQKRISDNQSALKNARQNIHYLGTTRLGVVLFAAGMVYWQRDHAFEVFLLIAISLFFFSGLLLVNYRQQKKKQYLEAAIACDEDELKALDYDFSAFDGAREKINGNHAFSLDLDIFGNKSLFQSVNRTCTASGRSLLIHWFENPLDDKQTIEMRQESVRELAGQPELIHHFRVTGIINPGKSSDADEIRDFIRKKSLVPHPWMWKLLVYLFPCVWLALIAFSFFITVPFSVYLLIYILTFGISECQVRRINRLQQWIGKKVAVLTTYSDLIRIIEQNDMKSGQLAELKSYFSINGKPASGVIRQLAQLAGELDQRSNLLVHVLLNPVFLWDICKSLQIEKWKNKHGAFLNEWIEKLGEFDAFCSLSAFSYNHPDYTFPVIATDYFEIRGSSLGHPLMQEDRCVRNDICIESYPYFMIVTGANMAGKSTYLRTVGVNFLLACIGAPVCAAFLSVYPAYLVTSLRTSDSLADNESYFFAELKRLQMIIGQLNEGKQLFIILDEILKGTNSVDKQKGSLALLRQFISLRTCGIIATHDLLLGELEKEFPGHVRNYCFEADINGDSLHFSYQLRKGIAQNMNACFLMEKMGIIIE